MRFEQAGLNPLHLYSELMYSFGMLTPNDLSEIKKIIEPLKKDVTKVKKNVARIQKDVKVIVSYFEDENMDVRKRVERIEDHLSLPSKN